MGQVVWTEGRQGSYIRQYVIIRVLQKYCGCGMDLAAMLSTGLKEAFRGCDQESAHLFHCMILVFLIPLYVHD